MRSSRYQTVLPAFGCVVASTTNHSENVVQENLEAETIFSLLEEKYDTPLTEGEYRLEAISADRIAFGSMPGARSFRNVAVAAAGPQFGPVGYEDSFLHEPRKREEVEDWASEAIRGWKNPCDQ